MCRWSLCGRQFRFSWHATNFTQQLIYSTIDGNEGGGAGPLDIHRISVDVRPESLLDIRRCESNGTFHSNVSPFVTLFEAGLLQTQGSLLCSKRQQFKPFGQPQNNRRQFMANSRTRRKKGMQRT